MKNNIYIVIAAFNEEKKIGTVVKQLKKLNYEHIIVVDDGSKDKTINKAKEAGAIVLEHKKNKGQGASLRTGIKFAVKQKADAIVTFDADGQHKASEISSVTLPILEDQVDVVLGSRFLGKHIHIRPMIRFLLWLGIIEHLILYGVLLSDVHNGFRAFSLKAAKKIKIRCNRMEHASEIIEEIGRHKLAFMEVPVTIKYTNYSNAKGQSAWDRVKVGLNLIRRKFVPCKGK